MTLISVVMNHLDFRDQLRGFSGSSGLSQVTTLGSALISGVEERVGLISGCDSGAMIVEVTDVDTETTGRWRVAITRLADRG